MIRTTPEEVQKTLTVLNYLDPREDPHRHRDFSQTVNLMIDSINNHADMRSMSENLNTMLKDLGKPGKTGVLLLLLLSLLGGLRKTLWGCSRVPWG